MTDLYNILQVQRCAEPEVVRAAHRALARKHHPDFGGDAKRMASINRAWAILGNPTLRAAYDTAIAREGMDVTSQVRTPPPESVRPRAAPPPAAPPPAASPVNEGAPAHVAGQGLPSRRLGEQRDGGTVLDFGRYAGWSVGTLADQDPNYLRWLARTSIGRRLSGEINAALDRRATEASALRPNPVHAPRRGGLFASLGTIRTASR